MPELKQDTLPCALPRLGSPAAVPSTAAEPSQREVPESQHAPRLAERIDTPIDGFTSIELVDSLIESRLIGRDDLERFFGKYPELASAERGNVLDGLVEEGLLSPFQAKHIASGARFGLILGNYRIVEPIGAGGMGHVFRAQHIHMKRSVAIKILADHDDPDSAFLRRFDGETEAIAALNHPNIVHAFDAGEIERPRPGQRPLRYLVMEYVAGQDLERYVHANGPLPTAEACEYVYQAASGLQHAHEHGLVHRDMKPSNLLRTAGGQIKILDFGVARIARRRHTEAHTLLGSVDYMAPEQARDARSVDIRADIYGLGGILYWLLSGQKPFQGERTTIEELIARQSESPRPLHLLQPDIPLELEAIVCQMMARNPQDRFATPRAVMGALGDFIATQARLHPPGPGDDESGADSCPTTIKTLRQPGHVASQELVLVALSKVAELRGLESPGHLYRMQEYVRVLAEEAGRLPAFAESINGDFIRMMSTTVLVHDVGKVGIPDHILLKPGRLDAEERSVIEAHTLIGAEMLSEVAKHMGSVPAIFQMALELIRHHHEHHDGTGYPDRLAGEAIPLAARIAAIADTYDALRSKLVYKPGLAHEAARRLMLESSPGQFDPNLMQAFKNCQGVFEQIFTHSRK